MKFLLTLNATLFIISAATFVALAVSSMTSGVSVQAQSPLDVTQEEATDEEANGNGDDASSEGAEEASAVVYRYEAQPGDSYTKMARKATQTYGLKFDVNLSAAQIVYVETNVTQAAGSPLLSVGQSVEIAEQTIADWVEQAQNLSDATEQAWEHYVPSVDFNTDNVGE